MLNLDVFFFLCVIYVDGLVKLGEGGDSGSHPRLEGTFLFFFCPLFIHYYYYFTFPNTVLV